MRAYDRLSGAFLVVVSIAICLQAARYGIGSFHDPSAGSFPFLMGLVVGALSLALLFSAIFSKDKAKEPCESLWIVLTRKKVWYIVLPLVAYGLLLERLGFILTTFFVFTFILHVTEPQKWWVSLVSGLTATLVCYALFYLALGVPLPQGILGL
jgi:putative tricarboxylic transport membrane protein